MKFILTSTITVFLQFSFAQDWQLVGFENYEIEHVYAKNDTIWIGTKDSTLKREIFYSFSGGNNWLKVDDSDSLINGVLQILRIDPNNSLIIYAVSNGRGLKSLDGGQSWQLLFPEMEPWPNNTRVVDIIISPHNGHTIFSIIRYSSSIDVLYRSLNSGLDWQYIETGFPSSSHGVSFTIAFDPIDSLKMYASVDDGFSQTYFYQSSTKGIQWSFLDLWVSPHRIIVDWSDNNRIYCFAYPQRSDDGGNNWKYIDNGFPGWYWTSIIDPINANILYMSTKFGVFKTINNGEQWILMGGSDSLDLEFSSSVMGKNENLIIDPGKYTLYIGTKKGLYLYNLITAIDKIDFTPNNFWLGQNYPNPFNPKTKINYELKRKSHVNLKVFDLSGKEIKTLVNSYQTAGEHSVSFNAAGLPSGIYLYTLKSSSGFSQSRKMLYIK